MNSIVPKIKNTDGNKDTWFENKPNNYEKRTFKPPTVVFKHSRTANGIVEYIKQLLGCTIFDGAGINHRKHITILKSVDDTSYYSDNLDDYNAIEYTLTGKNGNQDENFHTNAKLLISQNIYVYRVNKINKTYAWYGKYVIVSKFTKQHPGENGVMREIVVLRLHKVEQN